MSILIPSTADEGRADFLNDNSILDNVDIFVIEYRPDLLSQCDGIYVILKHFQMEMMKMNVDYW